MNLTITVQDSELIFSIELPLDFTIADFKSYIEAESDIKSSDQSLYLDSKQLDLSQDTDSIETLGLKDNDLLLLKKIDRSAPINNIPTETSSEIDHQCEILRNKILENRDIQPELDYSIRSVLKDKSEFKDSLIKSLNFTNIHLLNDINNITSANQLKILELLKQRKIDESLEHAYEYSPESFGSVFMLYISCTVNEVEVKAFVDSGAQMTIISPRLAKKCGLFSLIDKRFVGEARGVGSSKILGRIHSAPLRINNKIFPCTLVVLDSSVDLLLGLDLLKRYQANIDLKNNKLVISDTETRFLDEHELPKDDLHQQQAAAQKLAGPSSSLKGLGSTNVFTPGAFTSENLMRNAASAASSTAPQPVTSNPLRAPASTTAAAASSQVTADPAKVEQLVSMGFSRSEATMALVQCNNNVDLAAGLLFD